MRGKALLFALSFAGSAFAQAPSASVAPASSTPAAAAAPLPRERPSACVEKLPTGKERPVLTESFPARGSSGHALTLVVTLPHGPAETVLPTGFRFQTDSAEAKTLKEAGFILPSAEGGAGPQVIRQEEKGVTRSTVKLSFVSLPKEPGRHELTLPPLPITVARASGDLMTLCTQPHRIVVEDPTSSTPNPQPKPNPPPRSQREEWTFLKQALGVAAVAVLVGALLAFLIGRWLKRPRPVPPPPPPRPPWDVALEALHDLRHAGLTREGRFAEHFDRVSDIVRRYLGDRYGFDGLECTTREMLTELRQTTPRIVVLDECERFLRQADLVKFARLTPTEPECTAAVADAELIIERTVPAPPPPGAAVSALPTVQPGETEGKDG
jgi:hypothetical protein